MSLALDALQVGFDARTDEFGETLIVQKNGQTFTGILMPFPAVDPSMELGSDWRELSTIQVLRTDDPGLVHSDRLTQADGNTWKVVRRDDNPSDFSIKFWVVKVVTIAGVPEN